MASLIPGYQYDIFISYRQKDNKYDGWVTEFVEHLKAELESTFKEEISVYFDINPHDGLLQTHDVDASLKDKLKCLIFIPIISRTYCDPKSFAWEREFKAFVEQASKDQFGLKVKLPNGNVAGRVLPVRIHNLEAGDIKECESVLGGVLRGVEFIYKEHGVDKPLAPEDDERKNLDHTKYRIQMIKVAHAVKELISGMNTGPVVVVKERNQPEENLGEANKYDRKASGAKPAPIKKKKIIASAILSVVLLAVASILFYPRIFKQQRLQKFQAEGKISLAVMPFQNMTNDTLWNVWQNGIQDILVNSLSNTSELMVRQWGAVNDIVKGGNLTNYASLTPYVAGDISRKLDASVFVYGNIKRAGNTIRVYAQLMDSKTNQIFQSFQIEGPSAEDKIFQLTDSLSAQIKEFLLISLLKKSVSSSLNSIVTTKSAEAYRNFIYGLQSYDRSDYTSARNFFAQALAVDSNLVAAIGWISTSYGNQGLYKEAKAWCLKGYAKRDQITGYQKMFLDWLYSLNFETPNEEIRHLKDILGIDDQYAMVNLLLGSAYYKLHQYDKVIPVIEKTLELYKKRGIRSSWLDAHSLLCFAYHKTGAYRKESRLYQKAERELPDNRTIIYRQAILAFTKGKIEDANACVEKYKSILKGNSVSEAILALNVGSIYQQAGIMDDADDYYRQSLSLDPENPRRLATVAYFLVDSERNIKEGIALIEKAKGLGLDEFYYADCMGWAYYKQGKYKEALELLQKAWTLKPVYNHEVYLHMEAAKKAVAGQK